MDIHNQPNVGPAGRKAGLHLIPSDLTHGNREILKDSLGRLEAERQKALAAEATEIPTSMTARQVADAKPKPIRIAGKKNEDVIDLSSHARALADGKDENAPRVEALRAEHVKGTLNTPERIEKAARRMLEGE